MRQPEFRTQNAILIELAKNSIYFDSLAASFLAILIEFCRCIGIMLR
jgi:hypothetical protein